MSDYLGWKCIYLGGEDFSREVFFRESFKRKSEFNYVLDF